MKKYILSGGKKDMKTFSFLNYFIRRSKTLKHENIKDYQTNMT